MKILSGQHLDIKWGFLGEMKGKALGKHKNSMYLFINIKYNYFA